VVGKGELLGWKFGWILRGSGGGVNRSRIGGDWKVRGGWFMALKVCIAGGGEDHGAC
jgi:hypothetical protein